jgi:hypothetical protein
MPDFAGFPDERQNPAEKLAGPFTPSPGNLNHSLTTFA